MKKDWQYGQEQRDHKDSNSAKRVNIAQFDQLNQKKKTKIKIEIV